MSTNEALNQLIDQLSDLEIQLSDLQTQCQATGRYHGEQCSISLREALLQLSVLINFVKKADKKLIAWHHRSDRVKFTLRLLGVDRRTNAVVEKGTARLKRRVSTVEQKFHDTEELFDDGIDATASLRAEFADFSISSVGGASSLINSTCQQWEEDCEQTRELIEDQELAKREAREQRDAVSHKKDRARNKRSAAEATREDCSTGSSVMYVAAAATAASSFFFPPMAYVSGALAALGAGAAIQASASDSQAQNLRRTEDSLTRDLNAAEAELGILERKLMLLESQERDCVQAQDMAREIQSQALSLRNEAHETVENLNQARVALSSTREKIHTIAEELHEAQYAKSRREIAGRLREVLYIIQGIGKKRHMTLDSAQVETAMGQLLEVDNKTSQVLQILEVAKN